MKKLTIFALSFVLASASFAALDVYEGFDYVSIGNTLVGQGGALGTTGTWAENANMTATVAAGLTYGTLVTTGNAAGIDASAGDSIMSITHTAANWDTGDKWISWLYNESAYGGHCYLSGGGSYIGAAGHAWNTTWAINNDGLGIGYSSDTTYLMVVKVDRTAGMTYLWVDPTLGSTPDTADVVASKAELQDTTPTLWLNSYSTDGTVDEIRIGDTFADVTPTVPEPVMGLVAILALGLLKLRK